MSLLGDAIETVGAVVGFIHFVHTIRDNSAAMKELASANQVDAQIQLNGRFVTGKHEGSRIVVKNSSKTRVGRFKDFTLGSKFSLVTSGAGVFVSAEMMYTGRFQENKFHDHSGTATCKLNQKWIYTGNYIDGKRQGYGKHEKYNALDGQYYLEFEGTFDNDLPQNGVYYTKSGEVAATLQNGEFCLGNTLPQNIVVEADEDKQRLQQLQQPTTTPPYALASSPRDLPIAVAITATTATNNSNRAAAEVQHPSPPSPIQQSPNSNHNRRALSPPRSNYAYTNSAANSPSFASNNRKESDQEEAINNMKIEELIKDGDSSDPQKNVQTLIACLKSGKINASKVQNNQVIVIMGNTGAGKSTFVNYLSGCTMVEKSPKELNLKGFNKLVVVKSVQDGGHQDEIMPIGHTKVSKTFIPQVYSHPTQHFAFCDTPGFSDSRGPIINIANTVNVRLCLVEACSVKVVVLINFYSLQADRAKGLIELVNIVSHLFGDHVESYISSILVGLNQVPVDIALEDIKESVVEDSPPLMNLLAERMVVFDPLQRHPDHVDCVGFIKKIQELVSIEDGQEVFQTVLTDSDLKKLLDISEHIKLNISELLDKRDFENAAVMLTDMERLRVVDHVAVDRVLGQANYQVSVFFQKLVTSFETQCLRENITTAQAYLEELKEGVSHCGVDLQDVVEISVRQENLDSIHSRIEHRAEQEREFKHRLSQAEGQVNELLKILSAEREKTTQLLKDLEGKNEEERLNFQSKIDQTNNNFNQIQETLKEEMNQRIERKLFEMMQNQSDVSQQKLDRERSLLENEYSKKINAAAEEKALLLKEQEEERMQREAEILRLKAEADLKIKDIEANAKKLELQQQENVSCYYKYSPCNIFYIYFITTINQQQPYPNQNVLFVSLFFFSIST
jgi:energy-coupling factor transporter ATP-binding protein EcfA2